MSPAVKKYLMAISKEFLRWEIGSNGMAKPGYSPVTRVLMIHPGCLQWTQWMASLRSSGWDVVAGSIAARSARNKLKPPYEKYGGFFFMVGLSMETCEC